MKKGILPGLILIGIGLYMLAINFGYNVPDLGNLWPAFPCLMGIFLLYEAAAQRSDAIFPGTLFLLVGVFFFMFTLGFIPWSAMSTLWPAFPTIFGLAFLMLYIVRLETGLLIPTGLFLGTGLVFFGINFGYLNENVYTFIIKLWPLALIILGLSLLLGRTARHKAE